MKRFIHFVTSLVIAGLILFAVLWRFNLRETLALTRQARVIALMLGVALMVVAYLLRGARWQIWEPSLSYWDSLRLVLIGFMGNNVLPARLGEILRAHCASAKAGDHRGRTALLASVTAERILDGLVLATFGVIGIALVPVDGRLRWALLTVSLVFSGLAFGAEGGNAALTPVEKDFGSFRAESGLVTASSIYDETYRAEHARHCSKRKQAVEEMRHLVERKRGHVSR